MRKAFILAATMAFAVMAGATNKVGIVDTARTYELQNVQVLSTRATNTTPMAYQTLSKEQIREVNYGQDIPYLVSMTPSVTTTSDAGNGIGYTSIRIRGTDPSRVNVTANGIPMNDTESAQLFWVDMGDFVSSLQSIQIQRGVGTSTNGAGAFGASINMQTENIGVKPFIGLDLSGGSYYSHKETLRFGTGMLGGHWGVQGRLSDIGSKGYIDRASTKLYSYLLQGGYFDDNTVVKLITFNGEEQTYDAWNYASKYEQSLYGRTYNSCGEYDDNGNKHYYKNQTDNFLQQNYQLIWNQLLGRDWNLTAALHYTKGNGYYEEYKQGSTWAEYNLTTDWDMSGDLVRQKREANDLYGAIASVNYDNHLGLNAMLGGGWNDFTSDHFGKVTWTGNPYVELADGTKQHIASPNSLSPDHEYYRNHVNKSDGNIYAKTTWEFYKGLSAYADLQYRHVNYKITGPDDMWEGTTQLMFNLNNSFDFLNPKFGINWNITPLHRLYASYAIAHKEPTRNDYEDNWDTGIAAERLSDLEIGYQYKGNQLTAGANFYYMYYRNQFVLTGELNDIGEMIASNSNSGTSYRMGLELTATWQPATWFRWDANATLSRNRAKDWMITLDDGETANLGDTHLAFSPDFIFNNILTLTLKGFTISSQSQYISKQYLTNTDFQSYVTTDANGTETSVGMVLGGHFTTNLNLSYLFNIPRVGIKNATVGLSFYNLLSTKYDNNGWAAPEFKRGKDGTVVAYTDNDLYEAGFAPSAPFNLMAHLSLNF